MDTHVLRDVNCRPVQQHFVWFRRKEGDRVIARHEINLSTGGRIVREMPNNWVVFEVDGFIAAVHKSSLKPFRP